MEVGLLEKSLLRVFALMILSAVPAWAAASDFSGRWEAWVMGSRIEAKIGQKGDKVSGVAHIFDPMGKKDTYHFQGHVRGSNIQASHTDGHVFSGSLTRDGRLVGSLRTASGRSVAIAASKR